MYNKIHAYSQDLKETGHEVTAATGVNAVPFTRYRSLSQSVMNPWSAGWKTDPSTFESYFNIPNEAKEVKRPMFCVLNLCVQYNDTDSDGSVDLIIHLKSWAGNSLYWESPPYVITPPYMYDPHHYPELDPVVSKTYSCKKFHTISTTVPAMSRVEGINKIAVFAHTANHWGHPTVGTLRLVSYEHAGIPVRTNCSLFSLGPSYPDPDPS